VRVNIYMCVSVCLRVCVSVSLWAYLPIVLSLTPRPHPYSNLEHVAMMQALLGPLPLHMVRKSPVADHFFHLNRTYSRNSSGGDCPELHVHYRHDELSRDSAAAVKALHPLAHTCNRAALNMRDSHGFININTNRANSTSPCSSDGICSAEGDSLRSRWTSPPSACTKLEVLLRGLLCLDPSRRSTAWTSLRSSFFTPLESSGHSWAVALGHQPPPGSSSSSSCAGSPAAAASASSAARPRPL
jgi:hypothetical protein